VLDIINLDSQGHHLAGHRPCGRRMWSLGKVWTTGGVIPFNKQFKVDGKDIEIYIIDIYTYIMMKLVLDSTHKRHDCNDFF
jgi:hypothetical protein